MHDFIAADYPGLEVHISVLQRLKPKSSLYLTRQSNNNNISTAPLHLSHCSHYSIIGYCVVVAVLVMWAAAALPEEPVMSMALSFLHLITVNVILPAVGR